MSKNNIDIPDRLERLKKLRSQFVNYLLIAQVTKRAIQRAITEKTLIKPGEAAYLQSELGKLNPQIAGHIRTIIAFDDEINEEEQKRK